jgi:hypothetical protein
MYRAGYVPDLGVRERLDCSIVSLACQSQKEGRFVESVESFDQKVGLDCLVITAIEEKLIRRFTLIPKPEPATSEN